MGSTPSPFPLSGGLSSIWFQCQRSHRLHGGCVGTMAFSSTLSPKDMSDSCGAQMVDPQPVPGQSFIPSHFHPCCLLAAADASRTVLAGAAC